MDAPGIEVAAVEIPHRFGAPREALAAADALLGSEALQGVDLALLPEAILTGYVSPEGDFDLRAFAEPLDGPTAGALAALARAHDVALAGPLVEQSGGRLYNSLLVFDREGRRIGHYRKRHPWFPERWASPGDLEAPMLEIGGARVTAAVCFDVHFLSEEAGESLDEADLLLFPTAWVDLPPDVDLRAELLPDLARRHRLAIVNANWGRAGGRLGSFGGPIPGQGGSRILDARGRVVAQAGPGRGARAVRARLPLRR